MKNFVLMHRKLVVAVLAVLGVAGVGMGVQRQIALKATQTPVAGKAVLTVSATQLKTEHWPNRVRASGAIVPWQEAIVAAELGGLAITQLSADVGSRVQRGQELARLSDAALQATLAQQQANVAQQQANLALAESNAERARQVRGTGALSEQQITQYLQAETAARANLAAAEALLRLEQVRLGQTRILAADEGVISARNATLGAVAQAGSELFRLVRQGRLEWRAELSAGALERLQVGQSAELLLSNGEKINGKVRLIAPTFDGNTRKALAYVDLSVPAKSAVRAGLFAEGDLILASSPALTLPASAVVLYDGNSYVFEIQTRAGESSPEIRAVRHKVMTGRRNGDRVEIVSGLPRDEGEAGRRYVAGGGAFLSDGDRISVVPAGESKAQGRGAAQ